MDGSILARKRSAINDRMRELSYGDSDEPIAFVCECEDAGCFRSVWLSPADFDRARALATPLLAEQGQRRLAASV